MSKATEIPWVEGELEMCVGLKRKGVSAAQIAAYVQEAYSHPGNGRSKRAIWSALWKHKDMKISSEIMDKVKIAVPKALKFPARSPGAEPQASKKRKVSAPQPAELSDKARKTLETRLAAHRLKIESPKQSIELVVSGEDALAIFNRMVSAIKK